MLHWDNVPNLLLINIMMENIFLVILTVPKISDILQISLSASNLNLKMSLFSIKGLNLLLETGYAGKFNNANELEAETRHRKRSIVVPREIYQQ